MARTAMTKPRTNRPIRVSFVDEAYAQIKQKILDNEMPPGFQALEAELALQFGMSRTPIREALLRLQGEGFVRIAPRRGMLVLSIAPEDMSEIYQVITALETAAVEILAERNPSPAMLAILDTATDDMDRALEAGDLDSWAEADERFHRALLELCGNRRLAATAMMSRDQIRRTRMLTLRLRTKPTKSNDAHRQLVDAIRRGDAEGAFQIHRHQRQRAGTELMEILRRYRLPYL